MSNYRNRPKGNYIKEATWEELYTLVAYWEDDLEFVLQGIKFQESLIDSYFIKLLLYENLDELRALKIDLFYSKNECKSILRRTQIYLKQIALIIKEPHKYGTQEFRIKHEIFEDEISTYINNLKELRRTVYKMINDILTDKKANHLWKLN